MSKFEMIERIRSFNRSASEAWLITFDESALQTYLDRLSMIEKGRGKNSVWVRTGTSPAVYSYTAA
jgi:hypothetical protein